MQQIEEKEALQRLTLLCSRGEHCESEMVEKMRRWGIVPEAQARIMEFLAEERYIDHRRYCRGFIHDKMEYNRWGRRKIEQALWAKGIGKGISAPLLEEIEDERWTEILRPLIVQKRKSVKGRNDYEINQKLLHFALGRGFSFDQARKCIGDVDEVEEEW
ncbi:MAG: RecX family transcriptional regulator [Bacteroidales bacterium]|nr:RecX family transcriptional regulator [Bacteroidales bacterium]MCM1146282.1 RecX family transcriptional regulator [Bacteroidales bacterium]MCM1205280.1 RecX family transcriptional regulator [Bacillota bacterium]MCM1509633.1 RecX family transcriptional regulator [Clostridium sp.]